MQHGLDHGMAEKPRLGMDGFADATDHTRQGDHVGRSAGPALDIALTIKA